MYCSTCGQGLPNEKAKFCPSCGSKQVALSASAVPSAPAYEYIPAATRDTKSGQGIGVAGLITGAIGLFFGLYDYNLVQGTYDFFAPEEIGMLLVLSALGVVFSAVGVSRKSTIATWGLVISVLSLFMTFYLASLG